MPPARLAGTLLPLADAAQDLPRRCAGVRLSASAVLRDTEGAGARLRARQPAGRMAEPTQPGPHRTAGRAGSQPAAYLGLGASRVPLPGSGASRAEHRMRYTALLSEAGCKVIGERLKGSGMRRVEGGAVTAASWRAWYVSGGKIWDGFWGAQPSRRAGETHPNKRFTPSRVGGVSVSNVGGEVGNL